MNTVKSDVKTMIALLNQDVRSEPFWTRMAEDQCDVLISNLQCQFKAKINARVQIISKLIENNGSNIDQSGTLVFAQFFCVCCVN